MPDAILSHTLSTQTEAKQAEETSSVLSSPSRLEDSTPAMGVGLPGRREGRHSDFRGKDAGRNPLRNGPRQCRHRHPGSRGADNSGGRDMLSISRPSLIQLLDDGKIEYRKVGTHRRVRFESLMAHKRRVYAERIAVLNELAAYDPETGI